jgi:hypothetical protein
VPEIAQRTREGCTDRGVVLDQQHRDHGATRYFGILGTWRTATCRASSTTSSVTAT